jgi:hypothetical protein
VDFVPVANLQPPLRQGLHLRKQLIFHEVGT